MIIFLNAYQHHDPALLQPIANEAARRGWHVMGGLENFWAFVNIAGPKAAVQAAEFETWNHADGQFVTKTCHWRNIPTVGIQHGFPAGFHDRAATAYRGQSTSDVYCLWGEWWRDWFDARDYVVTGAPQLDGVESLSMFDRSLISDKLDELYQLDPQTRLGLLCPQLQAYPGNDWLMSRTIEQRADEFIALTERVPFGGIWLVRPHPSDFKFDDRMEQHQRIVDAIGGVLQRPGEASLPEVLPAVDVVAGMSTVLLEGIAYGADAFPIGVDYLPDDMHDPRLLLRTDRAAANICDVIERLVMNG